MYIYIYIYTYDIYLYIYLRPGARMPGPPIPEEEFGHSFEDPGYRIE